MTPITPPAGPAGAVHAVVPDNPTQRALARHEHRLPDPPAPGAHAARGDARSTVLEGGLARLLLLARELPPTATPDATPIARTAFPWSAKAEAGPLATTLSALLIKRATEPAAALAAMPAGGAAPAPDDMPPPMTVHLPSDAALPAELAAPPGNGAAPASGAEAASPAPPPTAAAAPERAPDVAAPDIATPAFAAPDFAAPSIATAAAPATATPAARDAARAWAAHDATPDRLALFDIAEVSDDASNSGGATLRLDLPSFGPVELRLALSGARADLAIYAGKDALESLSAGAGALSSSLAAWGIASSPPKFSPLPSLAPSPKS